MVQSDLQADSAVEIINADLRCRKKDNFLILPDSNKLKLVLRRLIGPPPSPNTDTQSLNIVRKQAGSELYQAQFKLGAS